MKTEHGKREENNQTPVEARATMSQESDVFSSLELDSLLVEQGQAEENQGEAKSQDVAVEPGKPETVPLFPRKHNPLSQPH